MKSFFLEWLNSKMCYPVLSQCLEGGFHKHKRPDWLEDIGDPDDFSDQVAIFWEFLRSQEGASLVSLEALVARQDWEGLARKIRYMYGHYKKEKFRDPLYQRVRQVLHSAAEEYGYLPGRKYSSYGARSESATTFDSYLAHLAFGMKPIHPEINVNAINTREVILFLAKFFKEQVDRELGSDCRIPIREFCAYIRGGYDVEMIYPTPGKVKQALEYDTGEDGHETHMKNDGTEDWPYSEDSLRELAHVLVAKIKQYDLLLLFCLLRYCQLKQRDIAKILGYSGPSGIHAPMAKLDAIIRQFFSLHDGLSEPDENEELLQFFGKLLLDSCKDDDCSRYE